MEVFRLASRAGNGLGAPLLIAGPVTGVIPPELVQVPPGEQAGVMPVIENDFDGILTHGLDSTDTHIFFTQHQHFLSRTMSFDLSGRRVHAEVLERQLETAAVRELHLEQPGFAADFDFGRDELTHTPSIGRPL